MILAGHHGISCEVDGIVIRQDSVRILTHRPLEFLGEGVDRLALRFLYGAWTDLRPGPVTDLGEGRSEIARIDSIQRTTASSALPLRHPIRWQPPTDFLLIETDTEAWILRATMLRELVFGADDKYHLFIGDQCFELTLYENDYGMMDKRILTHLPCGRAVLPTDMMGFTRWTKTDYSSPLVRDRFEFAEIRLLSDGEIESAFTVQPRLTSGLSPGSPIATSSPPMNEI